jgi:hypothetical protein
MTRIQRGPAAKTRAEVIDAKNKVHCRTRTLKSCKVA